MIRITSKNGELEEWESNSFDYGKALNKRATKIEKQAKDLTNIEMIKLKADLRYDEHFKEWYVAVAVFKNDKLVDEDIYRMNDYIDITKLVKE